MSEPAYPRCIPLKRTTLKSGRGSFGSRPSVSYSKDTVGAEDIELGDVVAESSSESGKEEEFSSLFVPPLSLFPSGFNARSTIHEAAFDGELEVLQQIHITSIDLNSRDNYGRTPLHCAILGNQLDVVQFLLSRNVKVFVTRGLETPLHCAVRVGAADIVQELVDCPRVNVNFFCEEEDGASALHVLAQSNHGSRKEICEILLSRGADCLAKDSNGRTALCWAVIKSYYDVAECIFKHAKAKKIPMDTLLYDVPNGSTLLHLAVDTGDMKMVELCLQHGARVNETQSVDGSTPVHMACTYGSVEILKLLLRWIGYVFSYSDSRDRQERTCLHKAAMYGHSPIIEFLLLQDIERVDDVDNCLQTPLLLAAARGYTDTVKTLLKHGADVQKKNNRGRTVLHCAVGHSDTIQLLLQVPEISEMAGATDDSGSTVLHYAATGGFLGNVSLLLKDLIMPPYVLTKNDQGEIPLHLAAKHGRVDVVVALLKVRDVTQIVALNKGRKTPLHLAAQEKHHVIVKLLLENAATILRDVEGHTPLHLAALAGCLNSVDYLIKTWPDCLNDVDNEQNTALHLAAQSGHAQVVTFLLSIKRQLVSLNTYGKNALDVALEMGHEAAAMAIAEHPRWRNFLRRYGRGHHSQIQLMVEFLPSVAMRFMDNFVICEGDPREPGYKITYDFNFLQGMPSAKESPRGSSALETMLKHKRLDCLAHPLCQSFLKVKWKTTGLRVFFPHAAAFFTYLLCGGVLIQKLQKSMHTREEKDPLNNCSHDNADSVMESDEFDKVMFEIDILFWLMLIFCNARGLLEISIARKGLLSYVRDWENILHVCVIMCTDFFLIYVVWLRRIPYTDDVTITASAIFMNTAVFITHLTSYCIFSVYITMIAKIIQTFLKVVSLLFMLIAAFSFSFYILLFDGEDKDEDKCEIDVSKLKFSTPLHAIPTTFILGLGEFEYKDVFFEKGILVDAFFVTFCLVVPVIFINLLIGLAIGDISKIKAHDQLKAQARQVKALVMLEKSLPEFILRRLRFPKTLVEKPEAKKPLKRKIVDFLVSLVSQEIVDVRKDETLKGRLEQHEDRAKDVASRLHSQSQQFNQMFSTLQRVENRLNQGNSESSSLLLAKRSLP